MEPWLGVRDRPGPLELLRPLGICGCSSPSGPAPHPPLPAAEGERRWSEQLVWSGRKATPQDFPMLGVLVEGAFPDPQPPLGPHTPVLLLYRLHSGSQAHLCDL